MIRAASARGLLPLRRGGVKLTATIKRIQLGEKKTTITEVSKKQRELFKAFEIEPSNKHCYKLGRDSGFHDDILVSTPHDIRFGILHVPILCFPLIPRLPKYRRAFTHEHTRGTLRSD